MVIGPGFAPYENVIVAWPSASVVEGFGAPSVAEPEITCHVMGWPATGWLAPSTSLTSSGVVAAVLTKPACPSPAKITSCGGRMLALNSTVAVGSSARVAVTWIGAGPGPVLV